ncbi:preprotein translocase subunit Sec61beta [Candidatus Micrarchaeota archaeon]|nr:preprotein translocase subunit Sec61beta [Candidatus Micrarchaeota archaeon]MBU1940121.1 preprotein translocase subunit Sec61beta [Candidatus Micrarchaeota archaeon]
MNSGPGVSGPSSSIGIMRFFDVETGGPKLTPEFVVVIAVVFTAIMLALHFFM